MEALLAIEMEHAIKSLERQIVRFNQLEKEYQKELAVIHSKVQHLGMMEIDYRAIERELQAKKDLGEKMRERLIGLEANYEPGNSNPLRPGPRVGARQF